MLQTNRVTGTGAHVSSDSSFLVAPAKEPGMNAVFAVFAVDGSAGLFEVMTVSGKPVPLHHHSLPGPNQQGCCDQRRYDSKSLLQMPASQLRCHQASRQHSGQRTARKR